MLKFINRNAFKLLLVWVIVLSILYSTLSILRHNHFQSGGFDLGLYDQAVWQYSRFFEPYNTIKERHVLGDHLNLTLPLLASLFWLWDDVRMLLIFQAFWIGFSSLAIYKLCRLRKFSPLISLNLSFIYSFFYGIQQAVFFDFHPVVIGVGLLAWVAYFLESGKTKPFIITLILLLATQENMGIALAGLGLIYLFQKKYRRVALGFIIGGFVWSFLAARVIASFSPIGFQYWPKISLNPLKILTDFFNAEEKRLTFLYSFSSFSFLPLLSPGAILAVFLDLSQYFITGSEFARMWSPFMHHRAILAPFLLLGTLDALKFLQKRSIKPQIVSIILVIITLTFQYFFHFPLNKLSKPIYWREEPWMADNRAMIATVPAEASVATQQSLVPHLSHRKEIYLVWPREHNFENEICGKKSCWWLDFGGKPQYLVVDLHPYQWLTQLLESNENFESAVKNMEKAGKIALFKEVNFSKLYKIN